MKHKNKQCAELLVVLWTLYSILCVCWTAQSNKIMTLLVCAKWSSVWWLNKHHLLIGIICHIGHKLVWMLWSVPVLFCVCPPSFNSWMTFKPKDSPSLSLSRSLPHARTHTSSRSAAVVVRTPLRCFYVCAGAVQTEVVNMAADGMVLTNHDHQTRVGILTGKGNIWSQMHRIVMSSTSPLRWLRCHDTSCVCCRASHR